MCCGSEEVVVIGARLQWLFGGAIMPRWNDGRR